MIPRGARHHWRNDGEDEVHVRGRFEPALRFEEFFESYFVIAAMGRSMRSGPLRGSPRPLQAAVLLHEYRDEIVMSRPPLLVQRVLLPPVAALGRLLGCRARYQIKELARGGRLNDHPPRQPMTLSSFGERIVYVKPRRATKSWSWIVRSIRFCSRLIGRGQSRPS